MKNLRFVLCIISVLVLAINVQAQEPEEHCIAQGDLFNARGQIIQQGDNQVQCFDTIAEAVFAASGGTIQLPSDTPASQLSRELLQEYSVADQPRSSGARSNYLLATYWENINKGGSSISIWSGQDCTFYYHTGLSTMPAGWDNRISSTESYSSCGFNEISEHEHHAGAKQNCGFTGCTGSVSAVMDNQTSSTYLAP